ncbi:MAG TPA: GTP-binding protein [Nitrospiria bacterium]|nr:GTP-binding protein [Nitrospiria bacterium]
MTLVRKIRKGDIRSIARLISMVENDDPDALPFLEVVSRHGVPARIIGITGPAGAGKSSLINLLIKEFRKRNERVGVLAVDPTSPFSGGSLLGDRLRMREHLADSKVFIRSLASRLGPGGIAHAIPQAVRVLGAAHFENVIIETVGAGQDEVDILGLAGVVLVVLAPGFGDEVQVLKAGLLEVGDLLVLNKSDLPESHLLEQHLLQAGVPAGLLFPVSALKGDRIAALVDRIDRLYGEKDSEEIWRQFCRWEMRHLLEKVLVEEGMRRIGVDPLEDAATRVARRETDPHAALAKLIKRIYGTSRNR